MNVLLDTNVILDLMLERNPWRAEAEAIAEAGADRRSNRMFAPRRSPISFTLAGSWSAPIKPGELSATALTSFRS